MHCCNIASFVICKTSIFIILIRRWRVTDIEICGEMLWIQGTGRFLCTLRPGQDFNILSLNEIRKRKGYRNMWRGRGAVCDAHALRSCASHPARSSSLLVFLFIYFFFWRKNNYNDKSYLSMWR